MYVVAPWSEFEPQQYRFADYAAYFRKVKRGLADGDGRAGGRRHLSRSDRALRHLPLAGDLRQAPPRRRSSLPRRRDLKASDQRAEGSAASRRCKAWPACRCRSTGSPIAARPTPTSASASRRGFVVEAREAGDRQVRAAAGRSRLRAYPPSRTVRRRHLSSTSKAIPSSASTASNICSAISSRTQHGALVYEGDWAFTRADEKRAFETFVDFVMARWAQFPGLHIYHYAPYEPAALKRLMGRYATREEEIDRMLRARLFVDLYQVVRHGLRASVESYSIKRLEPFYGIRARDAARRCECRTRQSPGESRTRRCSVDLRRDQGRSARLQRG